MTSHENPLGKRPVAQTITSAANPLDLAGAFAAVDSNILQSNLYKAVMGQAFDWQEVQKMLSVSEVGGQSVTLSASDWLQSPLKSESPTEKRLKQDLAQREEKIEAGLKRLVKATRDKEAAEATL